MAAEAVLTEKLDEITTNAHAHPAAAKQARALLARGVKLQTLEAVTQYLCPMTDKPITRVHAPPTGRKQVVTYMVNKATTINGGGVANNDAYALMLDGASCYGSVFGSTTAPVTSKVTAGGVLTPQAGSSRGNMVTLWKKTSGSGSAFNYIDPPSTQAYMAGLGLLESDLLGGTAAWRVLGYAVKMTDDTDMLYRGGEIRGAKFDLEYGSSQYQFAPEAAGLMKKVFKNFHEKHQELKSASTVAVPAVEMPPPDVPKEKDWPAPDIAGGYFRQAKVVTGYPLYTSNLVQHPTYKQGRSEDGFYAVATGSARDWKKMQPISSEPSFLCNSQPQSLNTLGWQNTFTHLDEFDCTCIEVYNLNVNYKHTLNVVYFIEAEIDPNTSLVKLTHDEEPLDPFFETVMEEEAALLQPFYPASYNDKDTLFGLLMQGFEIAGNIASKVLPGPFGFAGSVVSGVARAIRKGNPKPNGPNRDRAVAIVPTGAAHAAAPRGTQFIRTDEGVGYRILSVTDPKYREDVARDLKFLRKKTQRKKRTFQRAGKAKAAGKPMQPRHGKPPAKK